ncbi:MAG: hypothetical protein EA401_13830 [Planctomycetota bacterium]|nr:MAG: hypothetical protein EA401_13830 [Planctomycetota bacterium]
MREDGGNTFFAKAQHTMARNMFILEGSWNKRQELPQVLPYVMAYSQQEDPRLKVHPKRKSLLSLHCMSW